ncbi:MAG: hypothetical protein QMD46_08990 [Methanomicrobiales archaeon]|nr:hypothetical protein [Methanomicrobiales archaeon]MDI6875503.1 hypothetical protein [Methanomicrobiales archaeon]
MQQVIIQGVQREDGIRVYWLEGNETRNTLLEYRELIDMKINALDLLNNPEGYLIDADTRTIAMRK